jgi:hypothetical protein
MKKNINVRRNIKRGLLSCLALTALAGSAVVAQGEIIQADFTETLDLPGASIGSGPRVEQATGVTLPSAGPQLTAANTISNPSAWRNSLNVSFDATTDILSLTGDGDNDYQYIDVNLANLLFDTPGEEVIGIAPISTGNAVFSALYPFSTTPSFTADSIDVTYSVGNLSTYPPDFNIGTGTDTFQVELGSTAPEPSSIFLLATGIAGLLLASRRARVSGLTQLFSVNNK